MEERTYGNGSYDRRPEDKTKCVETVTNYGASRFGHNYQCSYKRGHGKDGLYCSRHAKLIQKREEDAKKCVFCKDTGHYYIQVPKKCRCTYCEKGKKKS